MKKYFTLFSLLFIAFTAQAQMRYFKGLLQGSQEVPPVTTPATGVVIVKYNTANRFLELFGNYTGLTAAATVSHIHSPAAPGTNAGVIINLTNTGGTTGTITGTATLTPVQETELYNGLMYVNVHNATNPNGEIRAQLSASTVGQTDFYNGRLQGAQEVPPNNSTATGSVHVLVDKLLDSVYLTGNFTGLSAAATASHIHNSGAPGVNGPVFQNLVFSAATSGTIQVAAPITDANQAEMMNGTTYVNVHNAPFPGGEIRAQLTMLSQMSFLKTTLRGNNEVPANASTAVGTVIVKYNSTTKLLELIGDYQNLAAVATAAHIHGPASVTATAPVLFPLTISGGTSGTITGSATLTNVQEASLLGGLMYVNVHNATYPDGEIRGQLSANAGLSEYMTGNFQGIQEVPPTGSTATGKVTVLLDRATRNVYVTGNFSGLSANATAGHLHQGITGVNGPVIVPLNVTNATSGTITGSGTVSAGFADSLVKGFVYANIHNATFPNGEIRAQLGDLVLPLKLNYFNGYKAGNSISLIWETSQEVNLRQFEIEQQDANGVWIKKSTVAATGGSGVTKYSTKDVPLTSKNDYVLYRLKMTDNDGKFSYSPIIRISFTNPKAGISIVANPVVNGQLAFTITGLSNEQKVTLTIADYNGRVVMQSTASSLQNNRLDISRLTAGMYKLIVNVNGTTVQESFSKY